MKAFLAIVFSLLAVCATAQTRLNALGKWAIVKVESGKYTEVRASECFNQYAPPVQISSGVWALSNPNEQTIQFVCVVWL